MKQTKLNISSEKNLLLKTIILEMRTYLELMEKEPKQFSRKNYIASFQCLLKSYSNQDATVIKTLHYQC